MCSVLLYNYVGYNTVACENTLTYLESFCLGYQKISYDRFPFFFFFFLAALPDTFRSSLKAVFAWIPEYLFPGLAKNGIPCPRCGTKGNPDGWNPTGARRLFMEHDVVYLIGFR